MIKLKRSHRRKVPEINMTPMIDIIFILLIFFLITASISYNSLKVDLPDTETTEKEIKKEDDLPITITQDNKIFFDKKEVSLENLEEDLKKASQKYKQLILQADTQSSFGVFVKILDLTKKHQIKNFAILTEPASLNKGNEKNESTD